MKHTTYLKIAVLAVCSSVGLAACSGGQAGILNPNGGGGGNNGLGASPYAQVDRLNRPAVNEVFATFAQHDGNNRDLPNSDAANLKPEIVSFMTSVAGRSAATANFVGTVLTPDVQIADMNGTSVACIGNAPGTCNNYLGIETGGATQAPGGLTPFGGRALTDDVVATSLGVIFGPTVSALGGAPNDNAEQDGRVDASFPSGHRPNLTNDNVSWQTAPKHFTTTFPYLGTPQ